MAQAHAQCYAYHYPSLFSKQTLYVPFLFKEFFIYIMITLVSGILHFLPLGRD